MDGLHGRPGESRIRFRQGNARANVEKRISFVNRSLVLIIVTRYAAMLLLFLIPAIQATALLAGVVMLVAMTSSATSQDPIVRLIHDFRFSRKKNPEYRECKSKTSHSMVNRPSVGRADVEFRGVRRRRSVFLDFVPLAEPAAQ